VISIVDSNRPRTAIEMSGGNQGGGGR
jgi:hypothetical protein